VQQGTGTFECIGCGRSYRWKPELAGRAVRCQCGRVMTAPLTEPADDVYDLADDGVDQAPLVSPAVAVQSIEGPALPMAKAAGAPGTAAPALAYQAGESMMDQYFPDRVKDFQAPLAFLVAGVAVEFATGFLKARNASSAAATLAETGFLMVFNLLAMLLAIWLAARFRGLSFGPFYTALLKLSAISIAPSALITFSYFFLRPIPFGMLICWALGFCLYFALIGFFFDLDQSDTWYCVCVIFVVKIVVFFAMALGARLFLG
jgi:hypothetical protein